MNASSALRIVAIAAFGMLGACAGSSMKQGGNDWSATAKDYRGQNGVRYAYACPANGTPGTPWGTDLYTDDSSVCSAAVHSGLITPTQGGNVIIEIRPGAASYSGTLRNGIKTADYGPWSGSYVFVQTGSSPSASP
jgi:hypothetical protein